MYSDVTILNVFVESKSSISSREWLPDFRYRRGNLSAEKPHDDRMTQRLHITDSAYHIPFSIRWLVRSATTVTLSRVRFAQA